jgi:monovalent cation:H+ antiporter, CPA1 family
VADLLHDLLARRIETVETALDGLRLQYPGHAEELERRFIRRTALRMEEREYMAMRDDGLIGAEVFTSLIQDLTNRRLAVDDRPRLDIAVQREDLVRQFPAFADLNDTALKKLSRSLKTRYVDAGKVILRKDSTVKSVFFIASGAVELESAGQTWRLGRGDMFGYMAILMNRPRRVEVRAIAPSTFLVLDEARFRSLLKRSKPLKEAIRSSAERRGIDPELLTLDATGSD